MSRSTPIPPSADRAPPRRREGLRGHKIVSFGATKNGAGSIYWRLDEKTDARKYESGRVNRETNCVRVLFLFCFPRERLYRPADPVVADRLRLAGAASGAGGA
jgi:hypothetical protein